MAIVSNFFDGLSVNAAALIAPWAGLLADGVFGLTDMTVAPNSPTGLSVVVSAGLAAKSGYCVKSDAPATVSIGSNASGYNRIDLIVLDIDTTNKVGTFKAVQGVPSSSPVAPVAGALQLPLAQVLVGNNASTLDTNVITDVRQMAVDRCAAVENLLINGAFDIWQDGTSFTAAAIWTADQWRLTHNATAATVVRQTYSDQHGQYGLKVTLTTKGGSFTDLSIIQPLPSKDCYKLAGKTVTFAVWLRRNSTFNAGAARLSIYTGTGTDEAAVSTGRVAANLDIPYGSMDTSAFRPFYITAQVPANATQIGVVIRIVNTSSPDGSVLEVRRSQLTATDLPVACRSRSAREELWDCQWHYEKSYDIDVVPGTGSAGGGLEVKLVQSNTITAGQAYGTTRFKAQKRVAPTMSIYSYVGTLGRGSNDQGFDLAANACTAANIGQSGFNLANTSGGNVTTTGLQVLCHWVANARMT